MVCTENPCTTNSSHLKTSFPNLKAGFTVSLICVLLTLRLLLRRTCLTLLLPQIHDLLIELGQHLGLPFGGRLLVLLGLLEP